MEQAILEPVKVYSPVDDKEIRNNLNDSPIWKQAYHADEYKEVMKKFPAMYEYTIKFNGTKPVQVTNIVKVAK